MQLRIFYVHIETSSLWAEFVNKNRCISVRLVSEEVKELNFDNFDNWHNSFLWPEYFFDFFYVQDGSRVRLRHPSYVYITAQRHYTAVQKMRTSSEITFLGLNNKNTWISNVYLITPLDPSTLPFTLILTFLFSIFNF